MIGALFLLTSILKITQCSVYVMGDVGFNTIVASFSDAVSFFGPAIFHLDGFLVAANPANACRSITPAPNESIPLYSNIAKSLGNATTLLDFSFIALIKQSDCDYDWKVLNAQRAGFAGAIVYSAKNTTIFPMQGRNWVNEVEIPSVMVDNAAGERLKSYNWTRQEKFLITMVNFYSLPLKYVLVSLVLLVAAVLLILGGCFSLHICNLWRRAARGRLSRRHLRRLLTKRFSKGHDPYETCAICLEDYEERQKLRLLPCHHAFHTSCIDPWLLNNHRRCPVCNLVVDFSTSSAAQLNRQSHFGVRVRGFWSRLRRRMLPPAWQIRLLTGRSHNPSSDRLVVDTVGDDDTAPLLQANCDNGSPMFDTANVVCQLDVEAEQCDPPDVTLIIPTVDLTPKPSTATSFTVVHTNWAPLPDHNEFSTTTADDVDDQLLSAVDSPPRPQGVK